MAYSLNSADVRLLEILSQQTDFDQGQLDAAAQHASDMSIRLSEALLGQGVLEGAELAALISAYAGVPQAGDDDLSGDDELLDQFSLKHMRSFCFFPIRRLGSSLFVATSDVLDEDHLLQLQEILGGESCFYVASEEEIMCALERYEKRQRRAAEMSGSLNLSEEKTHVAEFVDMVIARGISRGASDVHIEPDEDAVRVRYRVEGTFIEMDPVPRDLLSNIVVRIKSLAGINVSESRVPQDGRVEVSNKGSNVDLRVAVLPTEHGEMVCIRILDRERVALNLDTIGLDEPLVKQLKDVVKIPNGIFLVTGPTGSGKSTTLYSCLGEINRTEVKILAAEDPVEYEVDGIVQVQVHDKIGLTYANLLRSFLRQDPDVIMVGEIRDKETASVAVQASLTGHLVLSTLHTNDAVASITRLVDLGIEPYLISSSLRGVLAQRLVRKICESCRQPQPNQQEKLLSLGLTPELSQQTVYHGAGCEACEGSGYSGRLPLAEYFSVDSEVKSLITRNAGEPYIRDFVKKRGMITLKEQGVQEIFSGRTTVDEVLTWIQ